MCASSAGVRDAEKRPERGRLPHVRRCSNGRVDASSATKSLPSPTHHFSFPLYLPEQIKLQPSVLFRSSLSPATGAGDREREKSPIYFLYILRANAYGGTKQRKSLAHTRIKGHSFPFIRNTGEEGLSEAMFFYSPFFFFPRAAPRRNEWGVKRRERGEVKKRASRLRIRLA
jgi:hypothetical protein